MPKEQEETEFLSDDPLRMMGFELPTHISKMVREVKQENYCRSHFTAILWCLKDYYNKTYSPNKK